MEMDLKFERLEGRFAKILAVFREMRRRDPEIRPFNIEFFGTPKAGKTTILSATEHFLKRNNWRVTARPEGAEVVDLPRDTPHYNLQTGRYAMSEVTNRLQGSFEVVILDRGPFDTIVWMDYWVRKEKLSSEERDVIERYQLLPLHRNLFDLHICMVCDPETALERELAGAISQKEGQTMNPRTLSVLLESHKQLWDRIQGEQDERLFWHDSTSETPTVTIYAVLRRIASAFEARIQP